MSSGALTTDMPIRTADDRSWRESVVDRHRRVSPAMRPRWLL